MHSLFLSLSLSPSLSLSLSLSIMYIYIYIYMIKISGKVDKSNTYNGFSSNISFFIRERTSSNQDFFEYFYILAFEGKRTKYTTKPVVSVWFVHFPPYFYSLVRLTKIYNFSIYIYIYIYCISQCMLLNMTIGGVLVV